MTKAQQMLAMAGFPDTKQGRAAFHKMYPTPEDFFKVHGNVFKDFPTLFPVELPIKPENIILDHSPDKDYYLENTPADYPETDDDASMYKSGGSIHIKPSKRGTFTAAAKKHGKSVQGFASQVLANKENYSSAMVKKANFARNAAKWKHEDGGFVNKYDFGANVTDCPQGYVKDKKGNCIPVTTNVSNLPFKSNVQSVTNMEQSNISTGQNATSPLKFQSSSKIIDYYDNGMPNDTNYMYQGPNQSVFISTQKDPITGKPMSQFTSKDKMYTNMSQDSLDMYKGRIERQLKNQGGFAQGGLIRYADGGPTGGGEEGQFSPAKEYYKGWYNSPIYKSIIANQAKALFPDNEKKQTKFINRWNEVPNDEYWDTYANPIVKDFDEGAFGFSVPEGNIYLEDSFVKNNPTLANSLFAHEIKHKLPYTSFDENHILELTPKFNANIHKPGGNFDAQGVWHDTTPAYDNYLDKTDPDEVGTEIHAIRQLAKQAGVYDPYTEPFTKEHIDKLEKLYQEGGPDGKNFNQIGRLRKYYSDDQVIDMMNTISQNKSQSGDNVQMAALGSFVEGPPEDEYSYLKGSMSAPYDRFPKKDPGFNNGPGTYWSYMDRLKNTKIKTANPHKGVKDAPVNMHTITGSCESGTCDAFEDGGLVDAYKLMGMPTPSMFGPGGSTDSLFSMTYGNPNRYYETKQEGDKYFVQQRGEFPLSNQQFKNWSSPSSTFSSPNQLNEWRSIPASEYNRLNSQAVDGRIGYQRFAYGGPVGTYSPSYNFGTVQSANNTYRHGFGYGGPIGKYDFGSTIKTIGAAAYGAGEGLLDTVTMGATDQLTDAGYDALQKAGGSSESEIHKQNAWHGGFQTAGAVTGAVLNPGSIGSAISEGSEGVGEVIGETNPNSEKAQQWRQGITAVGGLAGMATGMGAFGAPGGGASGMAKTANFKSTGLGKFASNAAMTGQGFNAISSGDPMQMFSAFTGMGGMGNMGGGMNTGASNMNTGSGFSSDASLASPNRYMNQGINFNSTAPSFGYHAMGGAVNAPEMMQYADGGLLGTMIPLAKPFMADGGMTPATEINVEKGELLVDKNGRILTEYRGGGMVPHPEDGSMDDRGTVPAQEGQFVITKRLAPNYKAAMNNNDKLYAEAMRNNISFDKQRKEAKQQAMSEQMMVAKFGGMVRGYGYGGGIRKFDGGGGLYDQNSIIPPMQGQALPGSIAPDGQPTFVDPNGGDGYTYSYLPGKGWVTYKAGSNKGIPLYNNSKYQSSIDLLNKTYGPTGEGIGVGIPFTPTPSRYAYSAPPPIETDMEGSLAYQYGPVPGIQTALADQDRKRYRNINSTFQRNSNYGSNDLDLSGYAPTSSSDTPKQGFDYKKLGPLIQYSPALYNLGRGLFEKPDKVNPEDYMIKDKIKAYEEEYRPDYRPYNAMMYSMNRKPNSDTLAGKVNLFNTAQQAYADERYKVNQGNLARKMQADQANASINQFNANARWQGDIWNKQALAKKRDFIGKGLEQGSLAYQNERNSFLYGESLKHLTDNYDYVNGNWVPKKST